MLSGGHGKTSARHLLLRAQGDDPGCVTLPNLCHSALIKTADGASVKCFSVAVRSPNYVPEDKWMLVKLVSPMPDDDDDIDKEHIYVDHITCGILQDNRLQVMMGDKGRIEGIKMFPPEGSENEQDYWAGVAQGLRTAKEARIEDD